MSKNILIVESDTALSASLHQALEARGFTVQETSDGKGSVELIRRERPELVVLAVDLSAGQNGYLICGKLKKDDDLKTIPIVIIGNPDGFAQHRKLKAHADDYVAKPVEPEDLVERVGALIGFPELPAGEVVDDGMGFGGLDGLDGLGDEPVQGEELAIEGEPLAIEGEPLDSPGDELSLVDNTFGDDPFGEEAPASLEEPVEAPPELQTPEDDFSGLDSLGGESEDPLGSLGDEEEKTVVGYIPEAPKPAPAPVSRPTPARTTPAAVTPAATRTPVTPPLATRTPAVTSTPSAPAMSAADAAELRNLRARVTELESALEDSRHQTSTVESRVQELEAELEAKATELETTRASTGKTDQATFALREASNRKDKEILRLKAELNEKEQEIINLQDRQLELEQQANGASEDNARRDAQLKLLQTKVDQLTAERRRVEQQLATTKEETRGSSARVSTLETELDLLHAQHGSLQSEVEELRARAEQFDVELAEARSEGDVLREQLEQANAELESLRGQAGEAEELRKRAAELEESVARNESRVARLYARIKADEKLRERTRKALAVAAQVLEEQPAEQDDEEAVA